MATNAPHQKYKSPSVWLNVVFGVLLVAAAIGVAAYALQLGRHTVIYAIVVLWLAFLGTFALVLSIPSVVRDGDTVTVHNVTRKHVVAVGDIASIETPDATRAFLRRGLAFASLRTKDGRRVPMMAVRTGAFFSSPIGERLATDLGVPFEVAQPS